MNQCAARLSYACVLRVTLAGVMLLASACSLLVDTSARQCASQEDCGALGLQGMMCIERVCQSMDAIMVWNCLGGAAPASASTTQVSLRIRVIDVLTSQPPASLQLKFCPKLDVDCSHPLNGGNYFDEQGRLVLLFQAGFDGYVELTSPATIPALLFVTLPVWHDTVIENTLPMVSMEAFQGIANALGTDVDLARLGDVVALATDCSG